MSSNVFSESRRHREMDHPFTDPAPARSRLPRRAALAATACLAVAGFAIGVLSTRHNAPASASAVATAATATTTPAKPPQPPFFGHGAKRLGGPAFAGGPFAAGTIASISTSGFTVSSPDGSKITYTTSSSTTYSEVGVQVSRSALAVGERVAIRTLRPGESAASGTTHPASAVELVLPEVEGKFVSISGSQLIVEDSEGFWRTINLSSSTAYGEAGKSATESALKAGVYVLASGQIASDHTTLQASAVAVSTNASPIGGPGLGGPLFGPGQQGGAFFGPGPRGGWFGGASGGTGSSSGGGSASSAAQ
jgi:hypothetical protein